MRTIGTFFGRQKLNKLALNLPLKQKVSKESSNKNKVGVLCEINEEAEYKNIIKMISYIRQDSWSDVNVLAFHNSKNDPDYLQSMLSFDFFLPRDLNWIQESKKNVCINFINMEFDLLIDLTNGNLLPIELINVKTKAIKKINFFKSKQIKPLQFLSTHTLESMVSLIDETFNLSLKSKEIN